MALHLHRGSLEKRSGCCFALMIINNQMQSPKRSFCPPYLVEWYCRLSGTLLQWMSLKQVNGGKSTLESLETTHNACMHKTGRRHQAAIACCFSATVQDVAGARHRACPCRRGGSGGCGAATCHCARPSPAAVLPSPPPDCYRARRAESYQATRPLPLQPRVCRRSACCNGVPGSPHHDCEDMQVWNHEVVPCSSPPTSLSLAAPTSPNRIPPTSPCCQDAEAASAPPASMDQSEGR